MLLPALCCRCCCCRFFVETSATLFTTVLGQRQGRDAFSDHVMEYWLSDSNQGSFRIQVGTAVVCKLAG